MLMRAAKSICRVRPKAPGAVTGERWRRQRQAEGTPEARGVAILAEARVR